MNEAEWLAATDPLTMLEFLRGGGRASDRKVRLFAVACCRRVWENLDEQDRQVVEAAGQFADGRLEPEPLQTLRAAAEQRWDAITAPLFSRLDSRLAEMVLLNPMGPDMVAGNNDHLRDCGLVPQEARARFAAAWPVQAAYQTASQVWPTLYWQGPGRGTTQAAIATARVRAGVPPSEAGEVRGWSERLRSEFLQQTHLVRDIFGTPSRPLPPLPPSLLTWRAGLIPRLAQTAYDERVMPAGHFDPARLAVLADALEEAGCTDAEVLGHLRGPGPHVRGCHLVDLLLGKE